MSNIEPPRIDFDALPEHDESTAEENEKEDFVTFEEYARLRGIKL
jgi:hypothetical protein